MRGYPDDGTCAGGGVVEPEGGELDRDEAAAAIESAAGDRVPEAGSSRLRPVAARRLIGIGDNFEQA
jgi:hypothetical protein